MRLRGSLPVLQRGGLAPDLIQGRGGNESEHSAPRNDGVNRERGEQDGDGHNPTSPTLARARPSSHSAGSFPLTNTQCDQRCDIGGDASVGDGRERKLKANDARRLAAVGRPCPTQ